MKNLLLGTVAAAAMMGGIAASSNASAQVAFAGNTTGCFGMGCVPVAGTVGLASSGLSFTSTSFSGTTDATTGLLGLALGSFTLNATNFNYNTSSFTLGVTFTTPNPVTPTNSTQASAQLVGTVSSTANGIFINFDNTPKVFGFTGGAFTFAVNDVSIQADSVPTRVTGQIIATPGPVAGAGMTALLAFAGLFGFRRWLTKGAAAA